MSENKDHYYAFISYSHLDKKEVMAFHRFLEHYRIPNSIRKIRPDAPTKFSPTFIDQDNLAGTKLDEKLKQALEKSDYLIVVCSPNSAISTYVNDEVSYFIEIGRAERIIPYILSGKPNSNDAVSECYPPALRKLNPLGADVKDLGKNKARLRVIASMLSLDLDLLYQKEKRRKVLRTSIWSVLGLSVAVVGWCIYSYYRIPSTSYYQDFVEVNGIPEGIGESLSSSMRQTLPESCSITKIAGKVVEVRHVNSSGNTVSPNYRTKNDESAIREYQYDDEGNLIDVTLKDENGKELVNWEYSNNGTEISLRDASQNAISLDNYELLVNLDDIENSKTDGVCGYKLIYNQENGYLQTKLFTAYAGSQDSIPDSEGTYGRDYEYTEDGRLYRTYYLGEDGTRKAKNCGSLYEEYTYDDEGRLTSEGYYDENGKRVNGKENLSEIRFIYDENVVIQCAYNADGDFVDLPNIGTNAYVAIYDTNGNQKEIRYCDGDGDLKNRNSGYAIVQMEYDKQGHQTKVSYIDENEDPVYINGYYSNTKEYTESNQQTEIWERFYDENGNLVINDDGWAIVHEITDQNGNVLLTEYYDTNENPIAGKKGYFKVETEINNLGQETKVAYFDVDEKPYLCDGSYAIKTKEFDSNGECTDLYYWDGENHLVDGPNGAAHVQYSYDSWGHVSEIRYYGTDDQLVESDDGYAIIKSSYDKNGSLESVSYFGTDESSMLCDDQYHTIKWENENGRISSVSYFGLDDEAILVQGVHKVELDRNEEGKVLNLRNVGIHSQPVLCDGGYFSYEKEYDNYGNLVSLTYYDTDGNFAKEVNGKKGIKSEHLYDESGKEIQTGIWYWNDDGLIKRLVWDTETESPILNEYYNPDGTPAEKDGVHRIEYTSDKNGDLTSAKTYDVNGKLISSVSDDQTN